MSFLSLEITFHCFILTHWSPFILHLLCIYCTLFKRSCARLERATQHVKPGPQARPARLDSNMVSEEEVL